MEPRTLNFEPSFHVAPSSVGRVGDLMLQYDRRETKTILSRCRSNSPWHLFPPMDLDGVAYTLLLNASGGLVGGDRLTIQGRLGPHTHGLISTLSANRVYRSLGAVSLQEIDLHLDVGSILEWVPDVTIPFAGSRFSQRIAVTLERGATLVLWDGLAAGRVACGERWAFGSFENQIRIESTHGALVERYQLGAGTRSANPSGGGTVSLARYMEGWDYVGSLFVIGGEVAPDIWKALEGHIAESLDAWPGRVLAGLSEPASGGRVVKILAQTAPDLQMALHAAWAGVRRLLWGSALPELRRY